MGKFKSNGKRYLCAFLLPVILALLVCVSSGIYPFGEKCMLHIDMYHQYEPFFTEFMDKLKNGDSLLYSFRLGLGSDFVSLYAYYLASPLNWLIALVPASFVIEFMTVLIIVKIGFCGLSFAIYLWNHFENRDLAAVIFALFYALSGYMAAYSWNIMWLDCLALAPLVILGLERLVKEGKGQMYCISLAVAILSNFYIAMMLCMFLALWFVILFFEEISGIKERLLAMGRFAFYSLLAGGMGMALILPEAAILSYSGSAGISFPETAEWYFDLTSMLARHCLNVKEYTGRDHWPNLYCGAAVFLFLTLYLLNRKIFWKKKAKRAMLILLFWLSFANNILDFVWHGFHFPDSLPGRQAYLYLFLLLVLAYEAYQKRDGNKLCDIAFGVGAAAVFLAAASRIADNGMVTGSSLALSFVLTAGYGALLAMHKVKDKNIRSLAWDMCVVLAVAEVFANFNANGFSTVSRDSYTKNWESAQNLLEQVKENDPDLFYRTEEMERLTKNDAAVYGYNSATIFSSLMNIGVSRFYRKLGMEGGKNFYSYSGSTPLTSAMLSVKYVISDSPHEESPLWVLAASDGENYIYRNLYTLPLGFMTGFDLEENWTPKSGAPVANLNRLASALGALGTLLVPLEEDAETSKDGTRIYVKEDGYLYGTYTDTSVTNLTVTNGKRERKFTKCDHGYILDLGWCEAGDVVEITNKQGISNFNVQAYRLNMDTFLQAYDALNEQTLELDHFSDTRIKGHINVRRSGNLTLSIPKEDGFHIFVDGKEMECEMFGDSLIAIPLTSGEHEIELRYMTPGLKEGAIVSGCCLALFLAACLWKRRRMKNSG